MDDAREYGDLVRVQAVRIALAVRTLVVQLDDRQVRREERHGAEDPRAGDRVLLDLLELFVGQRPGLAQHVVADSDLADVVQQRAEPQRVEVVFCQTELGARPRPRWR